MAKRQHSIATTPASATPRRRLSGDERRQSIVKQAALCFAEDGFATPTRALAGRLGVTQALLYRYFPSKQALVEAVFDAVFLRHWDREWDGILRDRSQPLAARLTRFYTGFAGGFSYPSMRLFMRAALDGLDVARRYSFPLNQRILWPIIGELRHAAGLPDTDARPVTRGDRELALMLHAGVVFLGIRKHIYGMPLPDDLGAHVSLLVDTFMGGALDTMRRQHAGDVDPTFAMPMMTGRGGPEQSG